MGEAATHCNHAKKQARGAKQHLNTHFYNKDGGVLIQRTEREREIWRVAAVAAGLAEVM